MGRTRLYSLFIVACIAGYGWLTYLQATKANGHAPIACLIKSVTHLPCPSCGSSRSVMAILDGNYFSAFQLNPFGYIIILILMISPVWIGIDLLLKKNSFFHFYHSMESIIRIKWVALPMIGLVMVNWIWNMTKGL